MRNKSARRRVVVVATPGVRVFELAIPCEVLGTERLDLTPHWYDFELVGVDDPTPIGHGLTCAPGRGLEALRDADTVVVPACTSIHAEPPPALLDALRDAHDRGSRIAAICSGAFVLAAAGLLDGRVATTHWMHADELARRHPRVRVDAGALYQEDGDVWTSAGSAAGLDLCLELVRRDLGSGVANEVARRIVTPPHRAGDQAQYVRHAAPGPGAAPVDQAALEQWARENLGTATVARMAAQAGVSERTLVRQFHRSTRTSPQAWLQRERLSAAQELLETTDLTLEVVARRAGLGTPANLRARFSRAYGVAPHAYRRAFSG